VSLAIGLAACASAPPVAPLAASSANDSTGSAPGSRLALFPLENLTGAPAPVRATQDALERLLAARGVELVAGDVVAEFLGKRRVRYTGGLDGVTAAAAREDLGVGGVVVGTLESYGMNQGAPVFAATLRLISTESEPRILWMDGMAMAGDDAPGPFALGVVFSVPELEAIALKRLADSLAAFLDGTGPRVPTCTSSSRFKPRVRFRPARPDGRDRISVAVLPFVNETRHRSAGEAVASEFVRGLAARAWITTLEPGVVRDALLRHRVVMEGGVSLESARIALGSMDVDVVVSGYVRSFQGYPVPQVDFTVIAIDTRANRVIWQSSSFNRGDDGVFFFDAGKVGTAHGLNCRMVESTVEEMVRGWASNHRPDS
jgi:uncharacterized protein related to proFAR isomerase